MTKNGINLEQIIKGVRDAIIANNSINSEVFCYMGSILFHYGALEERTVEAFRSIIKVEFLDVPKCVEIIKAHAGIIKKMFILADKQDVSAFKKGVRERVANKANVAELARPKFLDIRKLRKKNR